MSYNLEISVQTEVFKNTHLSFLILVLSCFFCRISVKCWWNNSVSIGEDYNDEMLIFVLA